RIPVAVVGATGLAGQQFLAALDGHPIFELTTLAASARSAGKTYREAILDEKGASRWFADGRAPEAFASLPVEDAADFDASRVGLVFSAVDGDAARELEATYARTTPVVSTASAFRYDDDVPLVIPQVNPDHVALLGEQRRRRGWRGFVAPIPNCTTTGLAITLAPLARAFGLEAVWMTSLQAVSGAGRSPGVAALDVVDNVVPFIPKEEEKVELETRKILGALESGAIEPHPAGVSCTCTRVSVLDGHTESVFVRLSREAGPGAIAEALRTFRPPPDVEALPSAPRRWIEVHDDPFRPQPRLDRDAGGGMTTSVGRLRADPVQGHGAKYVLVSHNTKMGAAKGALLLAELIHARGML
ncbi:MAG TPA: aspartate-semialdehyde dehydrogenase, partial [Vulgatibacter sp.]